MPSHYDTHSFDEQKTEDAAGKKPGIKTHDNFGFGDMPAWYREGYLRMIEDHNKKKKKKEKKKYGK